MSSINDFKGWVNLSLNFTLKGYCLRHYDTTQFMLTYSIKQEVTTALNKFAPLHWRHRRPSKHITRWLSQDAINAKRQRRKLERVWKRSGQETDRVAYSRSCRRANKLNASHFKFFHDELKSAADCKERWRISKLLLNSGQSVCVRTANENTNLCIKFSQFLWTKLTC